MGGGGERRSERAEEGRGCVERSEAAAADATGAASSCFASSPCRLPFRSSSISAFLLLCLLGEVNERVTAAAAVGCGDRRLLLKASRRQPQLKPSRCCSVILQLQARSSRGHMSACASTVSAFSLTTTALDT